jgi:hypothetical protein
MLPAEDRLVAIVTLPLHDGRQPAVMSREIHVRPRISAQRESRGVDEANRRAGYSPGPFSGIDTAAGHLLGGVLFRAGANAE